MRRIKRWPTLLPLVVLAGCGLCGDENLTEAVSPDKRLVAVSFVRNCGATTDYVAYVQVRQNRRWFQGSRTVFLAEGVTDPSVRWIDSKSLMIGCNGCPSLSSKVLTSPDVKLVLAHVPVEASRH